jgi:hypothetical protein
MSAMDVIDVMSFLSKIVNSCIKSSIDRINFILNSTVLRVSLLNFDSSRVDVICILSYLNP